jgi:D-glycero-D-manno-heptose 1,7-bisphosphate phosphatase
MKLIILDRDGTINDDRDDFVKSPQEWVPISGALEAIARLNQAGWHVVVASNQSGVGRGLLDAAALNAIHAKMHKLLAAVGGKVDAVFFCPHRPEDGCACRKPAPGLFAQILQRYGLNTLDTAVHAVGDTARDLQAAVATGCQPHLVLTGKAKALRGQLKNGSSTTVATADFPTSMRVHDDLAAFAEYLLTV